MTPPSLAVPAAAQNSPICESSHIVAEGHYFAAVPDALSLRRAATIPQGAETARRSIDLLQVKPGQTVLVNAAAGSVGSAAVQMLVGMGATVIGTASAGNHDYLRSLGATPVEYGPHLLTQVAQVAPQGIDKALDGGGRGFVDQVLTILPPDQIITIADFSAVGKGVQLANGDPLALFADSFREQITLAAHNRFATQIAAEFALGDLPAAHTMSEAGHLRGKILVKVADLDAEASAENTQSGSNS